MKKFSSIISCVLCMSLFISVPIKVRAAEIEVQENIYDTQVIPDMYNTGYKGKLTPWREYFELGPETDTCYMDDQKYTYGEVKIGGNDTEWYYFENIDFSDVCVSFHSTSNKHTYFKNCYFGANAPYTVNVQSSNNIMVAFENCTFSNATSAAVGNKNENMIGYLNCLFYDMGADGAKGFNYSQFFNCYFHSIGSTDGSHADGLQNSGDIQALAIKNCRFNCVSYSDFISNACIFLTTNSVSNIKTNVYIEDVYLTGGNYSLYFSNDQTFENPNFEFNNINIGNAAQYGKYSISTDNETKSKIENAVKDIDTLYVSSVYEENEKVNLVVSNYTGQERKLLIITNNDSYKITIEACPDYHEGLNNTSLKEFPFDLKVEIPNNLDYIVCYDITDTSNPKQVRFVNNTGDSVTVNIESALVDASEITHYESLLPDVAVPNLPNNSENSNEPINGNINFNANIGQWFEVSLPDSYTLKDLENTLEFSVSGDIAGDKVLSVTTGESLELKNSLDEILPVQTTILKSIFTHLDLKNTEDSSISLSVEELPTGRFVGKLPIYISIINEEDIPSDVITGQINEMVSYRLENGVFTVSGTGGMSDYYYTYEDYREQIITAVIEDGVTNVGLSSFQDCKNLETVYLGNDVSTIRGYAFKRCSNIKSVYMPTSVIEVINGAFVSNNTNTTLYYAGTEEQFNQIQGVEHLTNLTVLYNQTW